MDGRDIEAKHHPLIVDGLVCIQQLRNGLVDGFWDSTLDNVAYSYGRVAELLKRKHSICCFHDGSDETLMRDGHLIVLAEHRDDTVLLQMIRRDFLRVGFDEWQGRWFEFTRGTIDWYEDALRMILDRLDIQRQQIGCRLGDSGSFHNEIDLGWLVIRKMIGE